MPGATFKEVKEGIQGFGKRISPIIATAGKGFLSRGCVICFSRALCTQLETSRAALHTEFCWRPLEMRSCWWEKATDLSTPIRRCSARFQVVVANTSFTEVLRMTSKHQRQMAVRSIEGENPPCRYPRQAQHKQSSSFLDGDRSGVIEPRMPHSEGGASLKRLETRCPQCWRGCLRIDLKPPAGRFPVLFLSGAEIANALGRGIWESAPLPVGCGRSASTICREAP